MPKTQRRVVTKTTLTARQQAVLSFIRRHIRQRGYGPTLQEIGDHLEIRSPNGVAGHLHALQQKGYILRDAYRPRTIRLLER